MPIVPWQCAHGEADPVTLPCAETVDIAPPDDSVDSNAVIILGEGDVFSLGSGPGGYINKRIIFRPYSSDQKESPPEITLHHNPPELVLVSGADRKIKEECYGAYVCTDQGHWFELYFTATGAMATENRITALEARIAKLEGRRAKRKHNPGD